MKKIIAKTALKTLLALLIAAIIAFGVASLGFPAQMATLFENMRAYNFASGYAGLAYVYAENTPNLARCLDDSILAGDNFNVVNYGDKLVQREDFTEYAAKRTQDEREKLPEDLRQSYDYYNIVYGNLACAKYAEGDKDGAMDTANASMEKLEGFPVNNALAALALASREDKPFAERVYTAIKAIEPTAEQQNYYNAVITILS